MTPKRKENLEKSTLSTIGTYAGQFNSGILSKREEDIQSDKG